jgi:hypothetical protein
MMHMPLNDNYSRDGTRLMDPAINQIYKSLQPTVFHGNFNHSFTTIQFVFPFLVLFGFFSLDKLYLLTYHKLCN